MSAFSSASDHAGIQQHQVGDRVRVYYHTMDGRERESEDGTVTAVVDFDTRGRDRTALVIDTDRPLRVTWNACVAVDVPDQTTNPQIGMWATVEPQGDEQ